MHVHSVENDDMQIVLLYANMIHPRCALFMNDMSHVPTTHNAPEAADR